MDERTPQEVEELSLIVDKMSALKMVQQMEAALGGNRRRVLELIGWAVVWGLTGEKSANDLRKRLEAEGMNHTSSYRAIADYKKISDYLLEQNKREYDLPELMRKMALVLAG